MTSLLLVSAGLLITPRKKILITQRPSGKPLAGLWEFPGGKIENGETPEAALSRELKEEIGISVSSEKMRPLTFASYTTEKFHLLMPLFAIEEWEGTVSGKENQQFKYISAENLGDFEMPPADLPLIPLIQSYISSLEKTPNPTKLSTNA